MKKKLMTMLLFLCGSIGVASAQSKVKATGATVELQYPVKVDSMWVLDPLKEDVEMVKPNQQGRFVLNFKPSFPRVITLGAELPKRWRGDLHLESGDHIQMVIDAGGNIKFSGKGAMKQEILYADKKREIGLWDKADFKTISANDLLKLFGEMSDASIGSLTANRQKVSPAFYKDQMINFVYAKKSKALGTPSTLKLFGERSKLSTVIPDGYWDLDKDVKQDDALLSNKAYTNFMTYTYVDFLRSKALAAQGMLDSTLTIEKRTAINYEQIEKHFTGKLRSLALSNTLQSAFNRAKDVEVFKPLLEKYLTKYALGEDAKKTLTSYENYAKTNVGKVPPHFVLTDENGKDVEMKDFAGKVVYMDFWASWCGPCRYEMKNGSPKLHAQFKDNKDVVFLYVSIDDRSDLWKKAIAEDKIEGVHLLSAGGFKSPVGRAFNINGVPHYIIIGKDGKIFDNNAPRPSQDITVTKINEALGAK